MKSRIPPARLSALIEEARAVPSIDAICFVGGECFLLGTELDALMSQATAFGFRVTCTTNGYWAVNRKAATQRIKRSAAAGLHDIRFSTGQMHAEFVPAERIVHGAVASYDAGLNVAISIEDFKGTRFDSRSITEHPEIVERWDDERLEVFTHNWIPDAEGAGKTSLRHAATENRFLKRNMSGCPIIFDTITVTSDLYLVACCGTHLSGIPQLRLGSVENKSLVEVLTETPDDVLKIFLHVKGPEYMLKLVERLVPGHKIPKYSAHMCQACLALHRDPLAVAALREHVVEIETELLAEFERMRLAAAPLRLGPRRKSTRASSGRGAASLSRAR